MATIFLFFRIKKINIKKLGPGYQRLEGKKKEKVLPTCHTPHHVVIELPGVGDSESGIDSCSDGFQAGSWQLRRIARRALSPRIRGLVLSQPEQLNHIVRVPKTNTVCS